ncbi:thioredoxin-disulfide reductase [Acidithrix ferrooxidans]|uniref:Thioredoxin reductase n=1 Tax=Acidithrix ferrooxidans TaxID=1280514 RepID=A0A0D8HG27_9ACTN|nr:thioredoxin-disulfide reductase [Acidithrix ferrooxidans]KJF16762.1 thioredoxin reductase [Acidithrix ferrooxidans]
MTQKTKVAIVGSGPAGLTAAIYSARANLSPVMIEGEISSTSDQPGGQLMLTTEIENFPGFINGIDGPELMGNFKAQAERFGTLIHSAKVSKVDFSTRPFRLWTTDQVGDLNDLDPAYETDSVIISTGARSLMLGVDREIELIGHGVSTCATCDGFFFRGKEIAVVGGGDSAMEEAIFLTKFATKVYVTVRRHELRASKIMADRAMANTKIEFIWESVVSELIGENSLEAIVLQNRATKETSKLLVTGLFVAIGHVPNTDIFQGQIDLDENNYIITHDGTYTSVEGVFACGDVQDHKYRQAITAAGSGCMAAIDTERWLEHQVTH